MKKYEKYKDSGIKWLGVVPEHWQIKRIKNFLIDTNKVSVTGTEDLLTVSHITGVTLRSEKNVNMFLAETNVGYKKCCPGDIIINTMWAWMGALGACKDAGICSPAYNVYRPIPRIEYHAQYFNYLFKTPNFIIEMSRYSKGIVSSRLRLYPREFYQIQSVIPPLGEQIAIANYLDSKTQLIDKKIELLNNKISYYKELRRSLINKVVCRGLDDSVKLKESGIDWAGKIPEHWEVIRFKGFANTFKGKSLEYHDSYFEKSLPNLSLEYLRNSTSDTIGYCFSPDKNLIAHEQDLIIIWDGAGVGEILKAKKGYISSTIAKLQFTKKCDSRFFYFFKDNLEYTLKNTPAGMGIPHLNPVILNNYKFPIPPKDEQKRIADYLEEKASYFEKIISNLYQQIAKLQKLRKTLINDVVTGKLKV